MRSPQSQQQQFDALLDYLKRDRGFDFSGYKRASLQRRIEKRMAVVGAPDFAAYLDFLELHSEEFPQLFNTILINVTSFFRDATSWMYLAREVVPAIAARKGPDGVMRVWSAGCASGEEAYTLVMLFAEHLGADGFRKRVRVHATDIDEEALSRARQATYSASEVDGVPDPLLAKYFEPAGERYVFRPDLRRQVVFGRHDLISDAPITRVDLLVCRNTLMYLTAETQNRILARFHVALNDGGFLFLGRAETLLTQAGIFRPIDLRRRISQKVARASLA